MTRDLCVRLLFKERDKRRGFDVRRRTLHYATYMARKLRVVATLDQSKKSSLEGILKTLTAVLAR